jgi:hypothetical protein
VDLEKFEIKVSHTLATKWPANTESQLHTTYLLLFLNSFCKRHFSAHWSISSIDTSSLPITTHVQWNVMHLYNPSKSLVAAEYKGYSWRSGGKEKGGLGRVSKLTDVTRFESPTLLAPFCHTLLHLAFSVDVHIQQTRAACYWCKEYI